jgi:hypothetical protein
MKQPVLDISPEATDFIRRQGGTLVLRSALRNGCCGGTVAIPVAEAGCDRGAMESYDRFTCGDVLVYIDRALASSGTARVSLDRVGPFRRLAVEGLDSRLV